MPINKSNRNHRPDIPRKTIYRLSIYMRCLQRLLDNGIRTVSSDGEKVVVPKDFAKSELYKRINLPDNDDDRMPPKGNRVSKPVADLIPRIARLKELLGIKGAGNELRSRCWCPHTLFHWPRWCGHRLGCRVWRPSAHSWW